MKRCLVALLFLVLSASAALACKVPTFRTLDNQTVTGHMFARSGRPCSIIITYTAGPIFTASLVSNASNGTVSVSGQRVVYTSKPGFVGDDQFTYARRGMNTRNEPIVRTINVRVNVAAN